MYVFTHLVKISKLGKNMECFMNLLNILAVAMLIFSVLLHF